MKKKKFSTLLALSLSIIMLLQSGVSAMAADLTDIDISATGQEKLEVINQTDEKSDVSAEESKEISAGVKEEEIQEDISEESIENYAQVMLPEREEEISIEESEQVIEEAVSEAITASKEEDDLSIKVDAPEGAFPSGTTATITPLSTDDKHKSYDITFVDENQNEVQPAEGKEVEVSFTLDESSKLIFDKGFVSLKFYHVVDGVSEEIDSKVSLGESVTLKAKVNHFSEFRVEADEALEKDTVINTDLRGGQLKPDIKVTRFQVYKYKHDVNDPPITKINMFEQFDIELDWDATSYGNTIKKDDYFEVTLPDNMKFPTGGPATQFELTDNNGNVVANGKINANSQGGGNIIVTFTNVVEGLYNVEGTMKLEASFVEGKVNYDEDNTFTIVVNGQPITTTIHVVKPGLIDPNEKITKYAYQADDAATMVQWVVRINTNQSLDLQNVIVSDELSDPSAKYIDGSIELKEVIFLPNGNIGTLIKNYSAAELASMVTFNAEKNAFTLNLGSPGVKTFQLRYKTTYPDEEIKNKIIVQGNGISLQKEITFQSANSSGTGHGNKGKVKIIKVDAQDSNIKLPKATFEIREKDTDKLIETMITGDNGEAISKTTLNPLKQYKLIETQTPPGYEVDTASLSQNFEFIPDSNKLKTITIKNKRIMIDVSGEKTWEDEDDKYGDRPDTVTVQLLADGQEVAGKTATVQADANGKWEYKFTEVPKFKNVNGQAVEIVYTVKEVVVPAGYSSEVNGMNVKNTYTPKEFDFKFKKTDVAGNEISGAKIQVLREDGSVVESWTSDGTAKEIKLTPGKYSFVETFAPEGYVVAATINFELKKDGSITGTDVTVEGSTNIITMVDDYKYHDVTVSKTNLGGTELSGAKITVKTADGTNLIDDGGTAVNTITWTSTNIAKVLKLRAGKYIFHEEAAPYGYLTVTDIEFTVDANGKVKVTKVAEDDVVLAEGGKITISDRKVPTVTTEAKANDEKETEAVENVVLKDVVTYTNLIVGKKYTAKLVWMDKTTGQPFLVDGAEVRAEQEFTATEANGQVELSVTVEAKYFVGETKLVAFEEVYNNNILVAAHKDIDDENQTVIVKEPTPELKTEAKANGEKETVAKGTIILSDTVNYKGLVVGKEYTLKLVWMDKATGQPFLVEGNKITAEKTFTATQTDGSETLTVEVDAKYFDNGEALVAFEKLFNDNRELAAHEDIDDAAQTVVIKENFNKVIVSKTDLGGVELTGAEIVIKTADGSELIKDGNLKVSEITWTSTDTPKELELKPGEYIFHEEAAPNGYLTVTDIEFTVDADGVVTVTKVSEDDVVLAEGGKITISDRKVPTVTTEAKVNDKKEDAPTDKVVLTDIVKYKDLIIGKTYVAKLVWMDKATGQPFLVDGAEVRAEQEFTATEANGQVELSVTVEAKYFVGETKLVAFEEVYNNNILVAAHKDIDDENQTVIVKQPKIELKTEAKVNGAKEAVLEGVLTLTDKVTYMGTVVGKEYTVKLVWMDQKTGKEILVDGKPLTAEKTFVATETNGEIELSVKVDSKNLSAGKLVAFETMYENGVEVGAHKDITDVAQMVVLKMPKPQEKTPFTGDSEDIFLHSLSIGLSGLGLLLLLALRKRGVKKVK